MTYGEFGIILLLRLRILPKQNRHNQPDGNNSFTKGEASLESTLRRQIEKGFPVLLYISRFQAQEGGGSERDREKDHSTH